MPIGSILGGLISGGANRGAGSQAAAAGGQALANSYDVGNRDVARLSPWASSGLVAAKEINALLGLGNLASIGDQYNTFGVYQGNREQDQKDAAARFQTDPGYNFRLQQGVNALDRSGTARGMRMSGAQAKAISDYGQNTGSAEYGNYFNRLAGVSGLGQTAAQGQNQAYNQALLPGISDAFQGNLAQGQYDVAGANAEAAGLKGAQNSLLALGAYGGSGGQFGVPGFGNGGMTPQTAWNNAVARSNPNVFA